MGSAEMDSADPILISMLIISIRVKLAMVLESLVKDNDDMPGHLARRFQQIAVAVFHAEVDRAGYDLTPVQYAALAAISINPGIDQVTLAGLIAYDRTTITGVVDRLVQKGLLVRNASTKDRRARELQITDEGRKTLSGVAPVVEAAQELMLRGLTAEEGDELLRLLRKAIAAGNELSRAPLRDVPEAGRSRPVK
ncbi:Putative transcriptional regulatory protein, MarR family [Neorhizobium galegae bv. orientalis]|nr:Putative transcriptional regulatory protein, MarR family [Neorhizobium galegae bv. orientalis]